MSVDWATDFEEGGCVRIWLDIDEAESLIDALDKYHSMDTTIKGLIADDDTQHYFIESLRDQIRDLLAKM